ncbi:MAG: glycosyl transferase family 2 [Acidobacteriaceae bacterium]|nr:glycosyl transferase family 2 [Acidobacteriaceae bacterium]
MSDTPGTDSLSSSTAPRSVCVVIPTYNRVQALLTCLQHLERQTWTDFEVFVVDDGSTDSTVAEIEHYRQHTPLQLRFLHQRNSGPARARNLAISLTESPLCIIIGDDIFPSPDFVKVHHDFHHRRPDLYAAGLGLTRWSETGQVVTPFMRWLDTSQMQFGYEALMKGSLKPNWLHFYTSNISLKTEALHLNPFNELFTKAAMEDLELGYRMEREHQLSIVLLPDALAHHLHPTSFLQGCKRMQGVGFAAHLFHELWPEHVPPDSMGRRVRDILCRYPVPLKPLTALTDVWTRFQCPNPLLRRVLEYHSGVGYRARHPRCQESFSKREYCGVASEH